MELFPESRHERQRWWEAACGQRSRRNSGRLWEKNFEAERGNSLERWPLAERPPGQQKCQRFSEEARDEWFTFFKDRRKAVSGAAFVISENQVKTKLLEQSGSLRGSI